jgi:hypothetical protein
MLGKQDSFSRLRENAMDAYMETFWNGRFTYNIVRGEKRDETPASTGLVSLVLLENRLFGGRELEKAWPVLEKMLVHRKGRLFGVLVKDVERKPYLDENEYHGAVSWPRDVPYLVRYLLLTGRKALARELLLNHLDHQMSEGAIFYNHELFSLPEGKNPMPGGTSEPVPVKNPVQYWSQFVEPFSWAFR